VFFGREARQPGALLIDGDGGPAPARRSGASAGRAGSTAGQSLVTRVSAGKRADAELRDLRGAATVLNGPRTKKAPSPALGLERQPLRNERQRLSSRMSALDAAKERLGVRDTQRQVLPRSAGEGAGAGAGTGAGAGAGSSSKRTVDAILAICYDEARDRLLYAVRYAAPWNSRTYDVWVPARGFGLSDTVLQSEAQRQAQLPVVFSTPWTGGVVKVRRKWRRQRPCAVDLNEARVVAPLITRLSWKRR